MVQTIVLLPGNPEPEPATLVLGGVDTGTRVGGATTPPVSIELLGIVAVAP